MQCELRQKLDNIVFMDGFVSVSHCDGVIHSYSAHFKQCFMQCAEN